MSEPAKYNDQNDKAHQDASIISGQDIEQNLHPVEELELLAAQMKNFLIDPRTGGGIVVIECDGQDYPFSLTPTGISALVFAQSGLAAQSHIQNVYQVLIRTLSDIGFNLSGVVIEAKDGDIVYARLKWADEKGRAMFNVMSVADALVLHSLHEGVNLQVVKRVLENIDPMDDWQAEDEYVDD